MTRIPSLSATPRASAATGVVSPASVAAASSDPDLARLFKADPSIVDYPDLYSWAEANEPRVIAATDNPDINPFIRELEHGR